MHKLKAITNKIYVQKILIYADFKYYKEKVRKMIFLKICLDMNICVRNLFSS